MRRKLAILALVALLLTPVAAMQYEESDSGYNNSIVDPTLTLVSPDGGESWLAGTSQYVNWTSVGSLGNVKLEYSKDNFTSDVNTIVASTANDGSYLWTVVNDPSSTVKVRISFVDDSSLNDLSNATFSLTAPSGLTHWWKLDESSGTTAADSQGSADGALYNMDSSDWVTAVLNNGLDFDGADDYVSVADQTSLDVTGALTLAAWVKPRSSGSAGDIGNSAIDSYEFDASNGDDPYIIPIAGDIYAIAYTGSSDDGWLKTVQIDSSGNIADSVIDSLEFDTSNGEDPHLIPIAGDIYAIAYRGNSDDGWLKTVDIDSSGNIADSVIDSLEFDTSKGEDPHIIPIAGDIYAIAYRGNSDDGWLKTVDIDSSGNIENSVIDSLEFDTSKGTDPHIIPIAGDIYAIAYRGNSDDGWLKTVDIDSSGNIENSVIDSLEFDTSKGTDPHIIPIAGDIYAIAYGGNSDDGWLKTVDIDSSGNIENSVIDSLEFDTSKGIEPHIISISGDIYAIAYRGNSDDGWLKTVDIDSSGEIANSVIDSLEFDTSYGEDPRLISIAGDIYAIAYEGHSDDGWLKTVDIDSSGEIANSVIDSLEYDTSNGEDPSIISLAGDIYAIAYKGNSDDGWLKTIDISSGNGTIALKSGAYGLNATGSKVYASINAETVSADISANVWQHVTLTYDKEAGGTQELKLFVNGSLQASADYSATISTNGNALLIGDKFDGLLDEVRFYNTALTTSQVANLYAGYFSLTLTAPNGGENWTVATQQTLTWTASGPLDNVKLEYSKDNFSTDVNTIAASTANDGSYAWTVPSDPSTTVRVRVSDVDNSSVNDVSNADFIIYNPPASGPDLRHWWKFDETSGTTAADSEGTTDGSLLNGAGWTTSGKLNGAVDLDGSNDLVQVDDDDTLDVDADDSVSFALWFKADDDNENQYLFYKKSGNDYYYLKLQSDGKLKFEIKDGSDKKSSKTSSTIYDDGNWYHVVSVINRTNDMMYIYVDGDLKDSDSISNVDSLTNSGDLYIGAKSSSGSSEFGGLIDEFRFYDVALTSTEVEALYDSY